MVETMYGIVQIFNEILVMIVEIPYWKLQMENTKH